MKSLVERIRHPSAPFVSPDECADEIERLMGILSLIQAKAYLAANEAKEESVTASFQSIYTDARQAVEQKQGDHAPMSIWSDHLKQYF